MKKLPSLIKKIIVPFIIAILALLVVGLYHKGVMLFGDTDLTYHFANKFFGLDKLSVWNDYFQSGSFDLLKYQAFYLKKLILFINLMVHNLYVFSYLWYYLPVFLFGLTFFFLIRTILKNYIPDDDRRWLISLIIAIASFMNGIFILYVGQVLFVMGLIFANLFLIIFFKNITYIQQRGKNNWLYLLLSGLIISESLIYLQIDIMIIYSLILLGIFNFRFVIKYYKQLLLWVGVIAVIVFLLNAQWLFVLVSQMLHKSGGVAELSIYDPNLGWQIAKNISPNIYFYELLRLKSYHIYNSNSLIVLLFGYIPIIMVLCYLPRFGKDKLARNMVILIIAALYLGYGIKAINEYPIYFLWKFFPFFSTFRTLMKFHFIYLYAFLILLSLILTSIKNYKVLYIYTILLLAFSLSSLFYYYQADFRRNMQMYQIPNYYNQIADINFEQNDKKVGDVMLLPQTNWQYQYEWAPAKIDSMNIFPYFYGKGALINGAQYESDPAFKYNDDFNLLFRSGDRTLINTFISAKNIKYIIYQNDARIPDDDTLPANLKNRPPLDKKISFEEAKNILNDEVCETSQTIGEIYFCRVYNSVFMPAVSFSSNNANGTIEFKKISATKYRVIIHDFRGEETLQLAQNYHADWAVYAGSKPEQQQENSLDNYQSFPDSERDQATPDELQQYLNQGLVSSLGQGNGKLEFVSKLIRKTVQNDNLSDGPTSENWGKSPLIDDSDHQEIVNGINGWKINQQNLCKDPAACTVNPDGSIDAYLTIEFRSQKYLYYGLIVSLLSFSAIVAVIILLAFKRKKVGE